MPSRPHAKPIRKTRSTRQNWLALDKTLEVVSQLLSCGIAVVRFLPKRFQDYRFQCCGNRGISRTQRGWLIGSDLLEEFISIPPVEWWVERQQFVNCRA